MNAHPQDKNFVTQEFILLVGRFCLLPFPTICMVHGGAVAGGCMLSFAHDLTYVAGKGKFSTKEVELQMHFPPGMLAIIRKRHPNPQVLRDMIIFSKEFQAEEAFQEKLIDGILKEDEALDFIYEKAEKLSDYGENKVIMGKVKGELHKDIAEACFNHQLAPSSVAYFKLPISPKI